MNELIILVGLPRSGKTTFTKELKAQGIPVVCPDDLRAMIHGKPFDQDYESVVWAAAKKLVDNLFEFNDRVALDATSLTKRSRTGTWYAYTLRYIYFDTSAHVCMERARINGQDYLLPIIERMDQTKEIGEFVDGDGRVLEVYDPTKWRP